MKQARALAESIAGSPALEVERNGCEWRVRFVGGRVVRVWTEGYALRAAEVPKAPTPKPAPKKKKPAAKKKAPPKKKG